MSVTVGDCRETMRRWIADGVRVQMCVTSPPYWGLRDYGCAGQLGLEPTIAEYVANMVEVFGLVRELLADDGTLWLQMGDSYCHGTGANRLPTTTPGARVPASWAGRSQPQRTRPSGTLKPKDLIGQPWRLALALQDDGWWLRSEIIWHKPNPMPETVRDRPTKSHETLFLLAKAPKYFYDADAIREPVTGGSHARGNGINPKCKQKTPDGWDTSKGNGDHGSFHKEGREKGRTDYEHKGKAYSGTGVGFGRGYDAKSKPRAKQNESFSSSVNELVDTRNKRSVWTIPTEGYSEAHFATFPRALVEPCIMAGSRVGDVVLDPFMGSGTVGQVARDLGRRWLGCELNSAYVALSAKRTAQGAMVLARATPSTTAKPQPETTLLRLSPRSSASTARVRPRIARRSMRCRLGTTG